VLWTWYAGAMDPQLPARKPSPSNVTDEEWAFVAPYHTLMRPDVPQRVHDPRKAFNALRRIIRAGAPLALPAGRLPAVAGGLPADPALDRCRLRRRDGA